VRIPNFTPPRVAARAFVYVPLDAFRVKHIAFARRRSTRETRDGTVKTLFVRSCVRAAAARANKDEIETTRVVD
jgi:hypothetical protein